MVLTLFVLCVFKMMFNLKDFEQNESEQSDSTIKHMPTVAKKRKRSTLLYC